jgi:hypothetical protein
MFKKLVASLDNTSLGFSGRKLTALFSVIVAAYVTYTLPLDVRLYALYSWQALALLCLGIITIEQVIKLKNGQAAKENEQL